MDKKIALIPLLYNENNYGGILQFYALQKTLINLGYAVETLKVNDDSLIIKPKLNFKRFLMLFFKPYFIHKKNKNKTALQRLLADRFKKNDLFKSNYYCETVNINNISLYSYYAFVCGSDQIWNPRHARKRAFLSFAPKNSLKIIYAASMGVEELDNRQKHAYKKYVKNIEYVSVREQSAKKILDSFLDRDDIEVVADPTLLLTANEWNQLIPAKSIQQPYIFVYLLGNVTQDKLDIISNYSKQKNLKIVRIPFASSESLDDISFGEILINDASPDEFLSLIKNADCIITDSFHACVFSILFSKDFYVLKRNNSNSMFGRIETLFNHFHIKNERIITSSIAECDPIDYSLKEKYQNGLINVSMEFLEKALNQK